jgi:hypothetical protein
MAVQENLAQVLFDKLRLRATQIGDLALMADPASAMRDNFLHEVAGINDAIKILVSVYPEVEADEHFYA